MEVLKVVIMKKMVMVTIFILFVFYCFGSTPKPKRVGSDTCTMCHDTIESQIDKTPHSPKKGVQCEDCHGPGSVHADDPSPKNIFSFKEKSPKSIFEKCKKCHKGMHKSWSSHFLSGESCLNCHDMWHSEEENIKDKSIPTEGLLKVESTQLCLKCHTTQQNEFNKPFHHEFKGVGNSCIQCHNPHKSRKELRPRKMSKKCASCHPDMSGPFIYVHLGTQYEGCIECHKPHGSTNPNLLTRSPTRFLCLSCHVDTPSFHDLSNPKYENCTSCHSAIHGSNVSSKFFE